MDSEPTSTQAPAPAPAPVSTETLSNLAPVTTPVTEPHAATNKEDVIPTNDIPNAEEAPNKQENETDESETDENDLKDDTENKKPDDSPPMIAQASPVDREKIMNIIFARTGYDDSARQAMNGVLDVASAIDLMLKTIAYEVPQIPAPTARVIAQPEIRPMPWTEWDHVNMGMIHRKTFPTIDVLLEEPNLRPGYQRSAIPTRTRAGEVATMATHPNDRGQGPLPIRVRINSLLAQSILFSIFDVEWITVRPPSALIMVRPFKALAIHSKAINAKLDDIERIYTERLIESASSKQADGEVPEGGKDQNVHREGDTGDSSNTKDAVDDDVLNAHNQPVASEASPRSISFFDGNNWADLTLAEVKEARDDFGCLVRFINETLQPVRTYIQNKPKSVNFDDIWHLFATGTLVYVKDKSTPQKIWKIFQTTGGRRYMRDSEPTIRDWDTKYSPFTLDCYYLDYDGTNFVRVHRQFTIERFEDSIPTASLHIMPLEVAERLLPGVNRAEFRKQGEQFLTYRTSQYRYYQGTTLTQSPCGDPLYRETEDGRSHRLFTERVDSQVVIDFQRGIQASPEWGPHGTEEDFKKPDLAEYDPVEDNTEKDNVWDLRASEELLKKEETKRQLWNKGEALPEGDDLILLPGRVFGYVLRTRSWACMHLSADDSGGDHLTQIDRRMDAWQDLEIPDGHRRIVQALINTHFSKDKSKDSGFDLVREKGKGVIVLLHGVPGVGKTATAECVAVSHGKPLLPITCGDLGLKPKEVEATLQMAFQLAQAWGCVMLLDEADIFLAQRSNEDIERNALVSVFLRLLEYYEGILFLTTNRVGVFDEAFKSRIHMALYYPSLQWPSTEKIWRNLIRRTLKSSMKVECNTEDLIKFAWNLYDEQDKSKDLAQWNGRQIRNAFQSAIALARNESLGPDSSVKVEARHFKIVAEVSNEFNNYIWRVKKGKTDAEQTREIGSREDDFNRAPYAQDSSSSQSRQFPPPPKTPMPMRNAGPNVNQYQGFHMQQPVPQQQGLFTTSIGSPYNQQQQVYYPNPQQPPQSNFLQAYGAQQPQYAQNLPPPPFQQPQAAQPSPGQQSQHPQAQIGYSQQPQPDGSQQPQHPQNIQAPSFQQPQGAQPPPGQQFQSSQVQAGYSQQSQPGIQAGYTTGGAVDPPQGFQPSDPRGWQQ